MKFSRKLYYAGSGFKSNSAIRDLMDQLLFSIKKASALVEDLEEADFILIDSIDDYFNNLYLKHKQSTIEKCFIQIKHDISSHYGIGNGEALEFLERNTVMYFHLNEFSENYYKKLYPRANHVLINHPRYELSEPSLTIQDIKIKYDISEGSKVFLFVGASRNYSESKWLIDFFNKVEDENAVLIIANNIVVGNLIQRQLLKLRLKDTRIIRLEKRVSEEELAELLKIADWALVPRRNKSTLNSGLIYLYGSTKVPFILPNDSPLLQYNFKIKGITEDDFRRISDLELNELVSMNYKTLLTDEYSVNFIAQTISNNILKCLKEEL